MGTTEYIVSAGLVRAIKAWYEDPKNTQGVLADKAGTSVATVRKMTVGSEHKVYTVAMVADVVGYSRQQLRDDQDATASVAAVEEGPRPPSARGKRLAAEAGGKKRVGFGNRQKLLETAEAK